MLSGAPQFSVCFQQKTVLLASSQRPHESCVTSTDNSGENYKQCYVQHTSETTMTLPLLTENQNNILLFSITKNKTTDLLGLHPQKDGVG